MKSYILLISIALQVFSFTSFAQDSTKTNLKATKGSIAFEINVQTNNALRFDGTNLKFRYFTKERIALRANLGYSVFSYTSQFPNYNSSNQVVESSTSKTTNNNVFLMFGAEKHFKGAERLSPYIGTDAIFNYTYILNVLESPVDNQRRKNTIQNNQTSLGIRLFTGADFYIYPKVFIGVEAGVQLRYLFPTEQIRTFQDNVEVKYDGTYGYTFFTDMNGNTRIGYRF